MGRTVAIGIQDFEKIRRGNYFYVDKTDFIREWWESGDDVTLIARPRRFGKTLNISMLEYFFSVNYKDRGDLFEGLSIWNDEKYRQLQGTYPVISLSFARVKEVNYQMTRDKICFIYIKIISSSYLFKILNTDCNCSSHKSLHSYLTRNALNIIIIDSRFLYNITCFCSY